MRAVAFLLVLVLGQRFAAAQGAPDDAVPDQPAPNEIAPPSPTESVPSTVVASDDVAFQAAIADALAPAGIRVRVAPNEPPPSIADIATASQRLAAREAAESVVWLWFSERRMTLIVYDRAADRLLVRSLSSTGPLTLAQAAQAARMARTMLRAARLAESDREGPVAQPVVESPNIVERVEPPALIEPRVLAIGVDAGVRLRGPGAATSPAGAVAVIWRPDRLGLALTARFAPREDVTAPMFTGRISDQSLALTARLTARAMAGVTVVGTAGISMHLLELEGMLDGEPVDDRRFNPAARTGAAVLYAVGPAIGVGFDLSADWLLRRQAYETTTKELFTVPRAQLSAGIVLVARIL